MRKAKTESRGITLLIPILIAIVVCGIPLHGTAAVDPACNATISPDLVIHVPVVRLLDNLYSLDLQFISLSGDLIEFGIAGVQAANQDCKVESVLSLTPSPVLKIASLALGSDNYDLKLEYVSSRQMSAGTTAIATVGDSAGKSPAATQTTTAHRFKINSLFLNQDVWKGYSKCKETTIIDYSVYKTTTTDEAIGAATFGRVLGLDDKDAEYDLLDGMLTYKSSTFTDYLAGQWISQKVDTITFDMNLEDSNATLMVLGEDPKYYWGDGFELLPALTEITTCSYPLSLSGCEGTNIISSGALWLNIPAAKFTRLDSETLSGKETTPDFGLTSQTTLDCEWFFIYYP